MAWLIKLLFSSWFAGLGPLLVVALALFLLFRGFRRLALAAALVAGLWAAGSAVGWLIDYGRAIGIAECREAALQTKNSDLADSLKTSGELADAAAAGDADLSARLEQLERERNDLVAQIRVAHDAVCRFTDDERLRILQGLPLDRPEIH